MVARRECAHECEWKCLCEHDCGTHTLTATTFAALEMALSTKLTCLTWLSVVCRGWSMCGSEDFPSHMWHHLISSEKLEQNPHSAVLPGRSPATPSTITFGVKNSCLWASQISSPTWWWKCHEIHITTHDTWHTTLTQHAALTQYDTHETQHHVTYYTNLRLCGPVVLP